MKEEFVFLKMKDGMMKTFIVFPNDRRKYFPVILFMDIWGVREELWNIARKIASKGYYAILPNLYYRQGDITNIFWNDKGQMISLHKLDSKNEKIVHSQRNRLSTTMILSDINDLIGFIDTQDNCKPGPIGSVGWCMGGWIGLKSAAEFPDQFQATATLHATKPISNQPNSPHMFIKNMKGGLYCGWAELDHLSPPSMIQDFEKLLKNQPINYRSNMHRTVEHGYALPDRDIYDQEAAKQDWVEIFDLYEQYLNN